MESKYFKKGARVRVFPRESLNKEGIILETSEHGIVLKIIQLGKVSTTYQAHNWKVGEVLYYPWGRVELALTDLQQVYDIDSEFKGVDNE